jgi:hypothetical protein
LKHVYITPFANLATFANCFFPSLIALPQILHFVTVKYCICPQSLFPHLTISDLPQASHLSHPMNVSHSQYGHFVISGVPHPLHAAFPRATSFRQLGHWSLNGLLLPHLAQTRLSLSIISLQWMQGCLYVAIFIFLFACRQA